MSKQSRVFIMIVCAIFSACGSGDDRWRIFNSEDRAGYVDSSGTVVIKAEFERAGHFSDGLASVRTTKTNKEGAVIQKWGYIDRDGALVITNRFDEACNFIDGRACVRLTNKWGYIDRAGRFVVPVRFDAAREFSDGLAAVSLSNKWGYIDRQGVFAAPPAYDEVRDFSSGLAAVRKAWTWSYINHDGKETITNKFAECGSFSEGMAFTRIAQGAQAAWIDKDGVTIRTQQCEAAEKYSEGLAALKTAGKWKFIDKKGVIAFGSCFDEVGIFTDGLAAVKSNGRWGYVDTKGRFAIQPKYDYATAFSEGRAGVYLDGVKFLVDKSGEVKYKFVIPRIGVYNRFMGTWSDNISESIKVELVDGKYRGIFWGYRKGYNEGPLTGYFTYFAIEKNLFTYAFDSGSSGVGCFSPRGDYLNIDRNEDRALFWLYKVDRDAY